MYEFSRSAGFRGIPDVATGTLSVFSYDVYALIELGATLSYGTLLVTRKFEVEPELLCEPFVVDSKWRVHYS